MMTGRFEGNKGSTTRNPRCDDLRLAVSNLWVGLRRSFHIIPGIGSALFSIRISIRAWR